MGRRTSRGFHKYRGLTMTREELLDYLIKNHFDYRCIIDEGITINATGLNTY